VPEFLQIAANAVNAKLLGASRETKLMVSELLSYEVEGFERTDSFKAHNWDGRSSFFDFRSGIFPAGLVQMVSKSLTSLGHQVQFAVKQAPEPLGPPVGDFDPLGYGFSDRYDYQPETVRRLLRYRRIVAQVATGGGKSNIAALAVSSIRRPTLFLTTRSVLMHQMKDIFEKAGFTPGVVGDGIWAPRKGVNVGMVQTLAARLAEDHPKRAMTQAFLSYIEFLIGEEAHEVGGTAYWDISQQCRNALYRLALTATPFMRADGEANMRLQGAFGSIGIQVTEKTLIDRGILATPYFKFLDKTPAPFLRQSTRWPTCYDIGIVENVARNTAFAREMIKAAKSGLTIMGLVQREKHGAVMNKMLTDAGLSSAFIFGKHEQSERKEALKDLGNHKLDVLIGSTILDVGVDVPAVGMVAIMGGGKAEVGHRQRIGRGLREKKKGANIAFMLDADDRGNKHLHTHALTRRGIIESTPGFVENILPTSSELPYNFLRA
jgi:superfamily II DNA or RNA helicase